MYRGWFIQTSSKIYYEDTWKSSWKMEWKVSLFWYKKYWNPHSFIIACIFHEVLRSLLCVSGSSTCKGKFNKVETFRPMFKNEPISTFKNWEICMYKSWLIHSFEKSNLTDWTLPHRINQLCFALLFLLNLLFPVHLSFHSAYFPHLCCWLGLEP